MVLMNTSTMRVLQLLLFVLSVSGSQPEEQTFLESSGKLQDPAGNWVNKIFSITSNARPGELVFKGTESDGYQGSTITMDDRRMGPNNMHGYPMDNSWVGLPPENITNVKFVQDFGVTYVTFYRPLAAETYFGMFSKGKEVTNHWNAYTIHGHFTQGGSRIAWPFDGQYINTYGGKYYQTPAWAVPFTEISDCCISWTRSPPEFTILAHSRRGTLVFDSLPGTWRIRWEGGVWEDLPTAYTWVRYDHSPNFGSIYYISFVYTNCDNCSSCVKETYYGQFTYGGSTTQISGHYLKDGEEFPYAWEAVRVVGYDDLDTSAAPSALVPGTPLTFSVLHNGVPGTLTISSTTASLSLGWYDLRTYTTPGNPGSYPLNSLVWSQLSTTSSFNYRPFYYVTFQRMLGTFVVEYHGLYDDLRGTIHGYYYIDMPYGSSGQYLFKFQGFPFNAVLT